MLDEEFHILIAKSANLPIVARLLEQMRGFARIMRLGKTQPPEHLAGHPRRAHAHRRRDRAARRGAAQRALHEHLHHWDYLLAPNDESDAAQQT